jgi:hypothetical protein
LAGVGPDAQRRDHDRVVVEASEVVEDQNGASCIIPTTGDRTSRQETDMNLTRTTARLTLLAITFFASLALLTPAIHALDLVSAPLTGAGFACSVVNASRSPQTITIDILDQTGMSHVGGPGTGTVLPGTTSAGYGQLGPHQAYCTVSSPSAKKGDIKLGFCNTAADSTRIAAVSAE